MFASKWKKETVSKHSILVMCSMKTHPVPGFLNLQCVPSDRGGDGRESFSRCKLESDIKPLLEESCFSRPRRAGRRLTFFKD